MVKLCLRGHDMAIQAEGTQIISLRDGLQSGVTDLLKAEGMSCTPTMEGLVQAIVALSKYHEEGVALFPELFISDDAKQLASIVQAQDLICVGKGPREAATVEQALKRCAPLARDGWAVYIERLEGGFAYGVLRTSSHPLALNSAEALISTGGNQILHAVMASQIGPEVVELLASCGRRIHVHFSAARWTEPSPRRAVYDLAEALTADVNAAVKSDTCRFLSKTVATALRSSHGTIVAVTKGFDEPVRKLFADCSALEPPIDVAQRVMDYKATKGPEELTALTASATLIQGLLASDGITVFSSDAKVLAYRAFIAPDTSATEQPAGGARLRTYKTLCKAVADAQLVAVFYQSHDGKNGLSRGS